jgi:hypothetical protein
MSLRIQVGFVLVAGAAFFFALGFATSRVIGSDAQAPNYARDYVLSYASLRLENSRAHGATCDADYQPNGRRWVVECTGTERGCDGLPIGDDLTHCLSIDRCTEATTTVVRDRCTDTPKDYSFVFSDRTGTFIED